MVKCNIVTVDKLQIGIIKTNNIPRIGESIVFSNPGILNINLCKVQDVVHSVESTGEVTHVIILVEVIV